MYEVIISSVHTGKVRRKRFKTWDQANQYAEDWQNDQAMKNSHFSRRDYRVEIQEVPVELLKVRQWTKRQPAAA